MLRKSTMACDSNKAVLPKSTSMSAVSSDSHKPQHYKKVRAWLSSWATESSDNGEILKLWCVRLAKEPGLAHCKYCRVKVNYRNKGLSALRCHANTRKHLDNGKLYHLRMSKGSAAVKTGLSSKPRTKTKKKPLPSLSHRKPTNGKLPRPVRAIGGCQNRVKLKGKGNSDLIKAQLNQQHHLKHTLLPSTSNNLPVSTPTLSPKFSIPILSKNFLQFKTKPSKTLSSPLKPSSPHFHSPPTHKPKPIPQHPRLPFSKPISPLAIGARSLYNRPHPKFHSSPRKDSHSWRSWRQYTSPSKSADVTCPRPSPVPALSQGLGNTHKSSASPNQVYRGASLRATGPPRLPQTVQRSIQLVPVFICYFCHEEFPSKSGLYEHQEQCTLKQEADTSNNNNNNNEDKTRVKVESSPSTTSNMETIVALPTTLTDPKPSGKRASVVIDKLPITPDNLRQTANVFFPSPCTPQKLSLPSSTPAPSLSSSSTSWTYHNTTISKPSFLNGLRLLPIKTALKEQKRISRKRRNTECESLDWVEEGDLPPTPKTPCTPSTPKLLISHLSREEYRRELPPQRLFRLSSSTSTSDTTRKSEGDAKEDDKDLIDYDREAAKSFRTHNAKDEGNGDAEGRLDGKISVVRSLYNVDVTSPLGQFVVRHYKADPSLHILSDIESHCSTSPSASSKTTNFSLRARNVDYPITFGSNGRRLLLQDFYHSYKFNKFQVREFMKTANTGLNKDSRRLLRQMKKCQVILRRISKSDLRYWISSQNNITVDLKFLSPAEIAQWTSPKSKLSSSSGSSDESDNEAVFPCGLKPSSPAAKNILGLKTKQVRIKTVNMLSPSVLNITNYVSEETCADLISNCKTVYRSLLSDWALNDCENVDVSNDNAPTTYKPQQRLQHQDNTILRRMLGHRPVLGSSLSRNTLPDITNLTVDKPTVASAGVVNNILPKLTHSSSKSVAKSKTTAEIDNEKSKLKAMKSRSSNRRHRMILQEDSRDVITSTSVNQHASTSTSTVCKNVSNSNPFESKDENLDTDEVDSCHAFINPPDPTDLLRETSPSHNSDKSRQSSPEEPIPSTSTFTPIPPSTSPITRRRQSDRLRQGPKWIGPSTVELTPPTVSAPEISSLENNPGLLKPFQEHFRHLREEAETNESGGSSDSVVKCLDREEGIVRASVKRRRSERRCGNPVLKHVKTVDGVDEKNDGRRLDVLKSFLEGMLKTDSSVRSGDRGNDAKGRPLGLGNWEGDSINDVVTVSGVGDGHDTDLTEMPRTRMSRLTERSHRSNASSNLGDVRMSTTRRRKSSPRVTNRVKKVGLNRRLSAAGLVKREGSLGSVSPVSSVPRSRSPVSDVWRTPASSISLSSRSPASAMMESPVTPMSTFTTPPSLTPSSSQSLSADCINVSSENLAGSGGTGNKGKSMARPDRNPSPITLVIRRDRIKGGVSVRRVHRGERRQEDNGKGGESPVFKPQVRTSRSSSRVGSSGGSGGNSNCVKMSASTKRSKSSVSVSDTRPGGLPKRKCLSLSQSSSSLSSLSSSSTSLENVVGASAGAMPLKSTSIRNASVGGAFHDSGDIGSDQEFTEANSTTHPQLPPMSKGGLFKFFSSFKLV